MTNLEVFLNGEKVSIDTPEEWDEINEFYRSYLRLTRFTNTKSVISSYAEPPTASQQEVSVAERDSISTKHQVGLPPSEENTLLLRRSWPERAWLKINRPATGDEIYHTAVDLGFQSQALNPIKTFKQAIRDNPAFAKIGENDNREGLWILKGAGSQDIDETSAVDMQKNGQKQPENHNRRPLFPPVGKQTADFAENTLRKAGDGITAGELVEKMLADGWTTGSPPEKRADTLRDALYHDKNRFFIRDGRWFAGKSIDEQSASFEELQEAPEETTLLKN